MTDAGSPTLGSAVYALACQDCRSAQRALAEREDPHRSVHSARKAVRRLRAVLSLAGSRFDEIAIADEQLRQLGRGLSHLRDAYVITSAARILAEKDGTERWEPAIQGLEHRCEELMRQAMTRDPGFARRRMRLNRIVERLVGLPWTELGSKEVSRAIKRSARRVAKAEKRARSEESPESIHRWRRRTRRLRMQWEAVRHLDSGTEKSVKEKLGEFASGKEMKDLKKLADQLGWYQDLQVLDRVLGRLRSVPDLPVLREQLQREIADARP